MFAIYMHTVNHYNVLILTLTSVIFECPDSAGFNSFVSVESLNGTVLYCVSYTKIIITIYFIPFASLLSTNAACT